MRRTSALQGRLQTCKDSPATTRSPTWTATARWPHGLHPLQVRVRRLPGLSGCPPPPPARRQEKSTASRGRRARFASEPPDVTNRRRGGGALANVSLRRQVWFAILLVAAGLLLIEGAARVWLALSSRPLAAIDPRSGSIETAWFGILEQDLETERTGAEPLPARPRAVLEAAAGHRAGGREPGLQDAHAARDLADPDQRRGPARRSPSRAPKSRPRP